MSLLPRITHVNDSTTLYAPLSAVKNLTVTNFLNIWNQAPTADSTEVGGQQVTITNWGNLIPNKNYLVSITGYIFCAQNTVTGGSKNMYMAIEPNNLNDLLTFISVPVSETQYNFSASFVTLLPENGFDIVVGGINCTTEIVAGAITNGFVVQLD